MKYIPGATVILLSALALLWRIDGTVLWRDEATTGCWAREMVERKMLVPRVFNGQRLIAQAADGHDFNDRFLPVMQGWLQFYVAALGFLVGGAGTVTARLPFVVAGAVSLWVLYLVGRRLSGEGLAALAAPVLGATSIYFLTAARQCRYYILVVLLAACILFEFGRYFKNPELARRWSFYLRLGLWGLLLYLANYVSFGGLWISLAVFVLVTRDRALIGRFVLLSAALAVPILLEFVFLHSEYVAGSPVALPGRWRDYALMSYWHALEIFRMIPLMAILPAAWYVFARKKQRAPIGWMALLSAVIIVVSVVATIAGAKTGAIPRYYFQVVPAALLLTGILAERLGALAGRGWAAAFFLFALVWPNLNWYHGWSLHVAERQLLNDKSNNEPMIDFLRAHVGRDETVAFYRNVQGMMAYFYLPRLQWVDLLDSDEPRNRRLRGVLPDYVFDDFPGVDWYVVWDNSNKPPKKLTADYKLVWEYSYLEPAGWWDRPSPGHTLTYKIYHRAGGEGTLR